MNRPDIKVLILSVSCAFIPQLSVLQVHLGPDWQDTFNPHSGNSSTGGNNTKGSGQLVRSASLTAAAAAAATASSDSVAPSPAAKLFSWLFPDQQQRRERRRQRRQQQREGLQRQGSVFGWGGGEQEVPPVFARLQVQFGKNQSGESAPSRVRSGGRVVLRENFVFTTKRPLEDKRMQIEVSRITGLRGLQSYGSHDGRVLLWDDSVDEGEGLLPKCICVRFC
jgi:hypothetical protein